MHHYTSISILYYIYCVHTHKYAADENAISIDGKKYASFYNKTCMLGTNRVSMEEDEKKKTFICLCLLGVFFHFVNWEAVGSNCDNKYAILSNIYFFLLQLSERMLAVRFQSNTTLNLNCFFFFVFQKRKNVQHLQLFMSANLKPNSELATYLQKR